MEKIKQEGKSDQRKSEAGCGTPEKCMKEDVSQELHSIKLPFRSFLFIVQSGTKSSCYGVFIKAHSLVKMRRPLGLPLTCEPALISVVFI